MLLCSSKSYNPPSNEMDGIPGWIPTYSNLVMTKNNNKIDLKQFIDISHQWNFISSALENLKN